MPKLLKLKKWLTLEDAAKHLGIVFGEEVTEADVLRLGIDSHLKLSVHFVNHAKGRRGTIVPFDRAKVLIGKKNPDPGMFGLMNLPALDPDALPAEIEEGLKSGELYMIVKGATVRRDKESDPKDVLELADEVTTLCGVYDLWFDGAQWLDVEHQWQQLTGGPSVTLMHLEGVFVEDADGTPYQLLEHWSQNEYATDKSRKSSWNDPRSFYPAGGLPADSRIVVRTSALSAFERSITEQTQRPLGERERANLHRIIGSLIQLLVNIHKEKPNPVFRKQEALIAELEQRHSSMEGFSRRNLEQVFAEANRCIKES